MCLEMTNDVKLTVQFCFETMYDLIKNIVQICFEAIDDVQGTVQILFETIDEVHTLCGFALKQCTI